MSLRNSRWFDHQGRWHPRTQLPRLGQFEDPFEVAPGQFRIVEAKTEEATIFLAGGKTNYMRLSGDIPLPVADKIVESFASEGFRLQHRLQHLDPKLNSPPKSWTEQHTLVANTSRDTYTIWFSSGSRSDVGFEVQLQDGEVVKVAPAGVIHSD
jgi:hypothetical protein